MDVWRGPLALTGSFSSFADHCVDFLNSSIWENKTLPPNATSSVIEFWEYVFWFSVSVPFQCSQSGGYEFGLRNTQGSFRTVCWKPRCGPIHWVALSKSCALKNQRWVSDITTLQPFCYPRWKWEISTLINWLPFPLPPLPSPFLSFWHSPPVYDRKNGS